MQKNNSTKPIPVVDFTYLNPLVDHEVISSAKQLFMESGCLLIRSAFDRDYIAELHDIYCKQYASYFDDREYADALTVGDKRRQVTVAVDGSFNTPRFYANQKIMPLLRSLLGDAMIIGSVGSVVALPGSKSQKAHLDHANIYHEILEEYEKDGKDCPALPPYAITVVIPLVNIDEATGCTRSWPGSHMMWSSEINQRIDDETNNRGSGVDFTAEMGDCYFMDYRLLHGGLSNNSSKVRPIIYNVYYRPWFRDIANYDKQLPLVLSDENYAKIPPGFRKLFSWMKPGLPTELGRSDLCFCGSGTRYLYCCHGKTY